MTHADGPATAAARPETAWPLENLLFSTALVARRMPWADLPARTLGLDALTLDGLTSRLMAHLRSGRDGRPVRLRTPFGAFLVPLTRADAESLLARADGAGALGTPSGLAADGRRYGLSPHVVPAGAREAAAQGGAGGLSAQVAEHLAAVTGARREDGTLDRDRWEAVMLRLSRYVVLGSEAAEDTLLSEMVSAAADAAGGRAYGARAAVVRRRMAPYLADPEPGCLAGRLAAGGRGGPEPHQAVAHALAMVSAATGVPALNALALLAADADASGTRADATGTAPSAGEATDRAADRAMGRALEQHPALTAVVYPVRAPLRAQGLAIGAGEEILYDPALLGRRVEGERTDPAWALCGNPSGCAVAGFAARVGREVVRQVAGAVRPVVPHARFAVDCPTDTADSRAVAVAAPLGAYGARGRVGADRLDRHAQSLSACAADTGWSGSEAGERFRMVLLAHADRCSRAASDVRRAAGWLAD
ncbi:hypothetical protein [Streptomyces sp. NBC_01233]|uniref:hypothetical protein n=1 Tax=Streptomyces sp. NBC_01233 TaxID=2903787 RepID=UPI002E11B7FF|nr:hypothetical protein OG332_00465 [Streptomyces sp. NBC_01233]WSP95270.1 hypothetical protein OG332_46520 [Streptomyces sp. NBC_01233]